MSVLHWCIKVYGTMNLGALVLLLFLDNAEVFPLPLSI